MGTDVWSECGVIASTKEIVNIVNGKNKNKIIEICQSFYDSLDNQQLKEHFEALNKISKKSTIRNIQDILESIVIVDGSPSKYDTEICIRYSDNIEDLFSNIIEETIPDFPNLISVDAFGSCRYNGYEVPLGEACFIFNSDDFYEKKLTEKGKLFKKIIGHCVEREWTIVSY